MKNLRTHGKKKIQWAFIIAAFAVILLFTACQQFLDNPEDFLSYWASESFVKDHNIGSAHKPDSTGVQCVGSSNDADITLSMHNPKNFSLVMPTASAPAGIVEFKELSEQPAAGTYYELKQVDSGTLKLTYKQDFLKKYEQGSGSLNPTITLKAQDGRVFQKTYTFGIKSNTPPPKPKEIIIAKTKITLQEPKPYYVLCLKFDPDEMNNKVAIGSGPQVPVHKDIEKITIKKDSSNNDSSNNDSSYKLLYNGNGVNSNFQTFDVDSFITHGAVAKLTEDIPAAQDKWVLYYKTDIIIANGNPQTSYTITLHDEGGVVSDEAAATIKASGPTRTVTFSVENETVGMLTAKVDSINISSGSGVADGKTVTFTATPSDSNQYKVGDWTCTPSSSSFTGTSGNSNASLTVNEDTTVTVRFVQLDDLTLTKLEIHGKNAKSGYVTLPYDVTQVTQSDITLEFSGHSGIPFTVTPTLPLNLMPGETKPIIIKVAASPGNYPAWSKTVNITREQNNVANLKSFKLNGEAKSAPFNSEYTVASDTAEVKDFAFDAASTGATASVSPQGNVNIPAGTGRSFTITVKAQDGTVKQTITFTVKRKEYTVNYSVDGGHGKIKADLGSEVVNGSVSVAHNGSVTFTAIPDDGWELNGWTGVSSSLLTATLSNVTGNKTVTVKFKPGELHFNSGGPDAWKRLKKEVEKTEGSHTIVINGEITATDHEGNHGEITLGRDLTIMGGSGAVLNANDRSRIFKVENGKTLTLKDITLKNGKTGQFVGGGGVYIDDGGTLIMQDSSTITNCTAGMGGGVYVNGTFKMEGSALVTNETGRNNEVYLESGKTVTVTGALTHTPAAKIRVADYQKNRELAVGERAKKENFKLAPDGGNNWRYKKVGNEVKFVTGKLTYTIEKIISIKEHDGGTWAEYYWTMKIDGKNVSRKKPGDSWKPQTPTDPTEPRPEYPINSSREVLFEHADEKTVGAYFLIKEEDHGTGSDDTVANVTKDIKYKNDQLKFEGETISLDQEKSFRLEFRSGEGDVDVVCRIRWEDE